MTIMINKTKIITVIDLKFQIRTKDGLLLLLLLQDLDDNVGCLDALFVNNIDEYGG